MDDFLQWMQHQPLKVGDCTKKMKMTTFAAGKLRICWRALCIFFLCIYLPYEVKCECVNITQCGLKVTVFAKHGLGSFTSVTFVNSLYLNLTTSLPYKSFWVFPCTMTFIKTRRCLFTAYLHILAFFLHYCQSHGCRILHYYYYWRGSEEDPRPGHLWDMSAQLQTAKVTKVFSRLLWAVSTTSWMCGKTPMSKMP